MKKSRHLLIGLVITTTIGLSFSIAFSFGWLYIAQVRASDFLFKATSYGGEAKVHERIVIVEIDDKSLDRLGHLSLWPRTYYARVIDTLVEAEARIVAFDILFAESSYGDEDMAYSITKAGNIILPLAYKAFSSNSETVTQTSRNEEIIRPLAIFEQESLAVGHINVSPDADGIVRRIPIAIGSESKSDPSLALATVAKYLRRPDIITSPIKDNTLSSAGRTIPINDNNQMVINYIAGSEKADKATEYQTISFSDLLDKQVDTTLFRDKILVIGVTASAISDYFWTPMGQRISGVEIHADAINTILTGNFLKPASNTVSNILIIALALICGLLVLQMKTKWATLFTILLCIIYLISAFVLFDSGLILNMLYPPLVIAGTFTGTNLYNVISERREKSEVTKIFGRYVSPSVVDRILLASDKDELKLKGEVREITTMFADVRNFTGIAEKHEPEELLRTLNVYLAAITKAVLKCNGMVNKFGGDSIMAIWNAPIEQDQSALAAIESAVFALREIRESKKDKAALIDMEFGIGINTGKAVVGDIGSEEHLEYTVIGDSVNTAARIASAAPGGKIWIGCDTFKKVRNDINTQPPIALSIKGKREPIEVYEVISLDGCQAMTD